MKILLMLLLISGCGDEKYYRDVANQRLFRTGVYVMDRLGLCYFVVDAGTNSQSFSNVPCTDEVLEEIKKN